MQQLQQEKLRATHPRIADGLVVRALAVRKPEFKDLLQSGESNLVSPMPGKHPTLWDIGYKRLHAHIVYWS